MAAADRAVDDLPPVLVGPARGPATRTLDTCLAALDRKLPAGVRMLEAEPVPPTLRGLVDDWRSRTSLRMACRRGRRPGMQPARVPNDACAAAGGDGALLAADTRPAAGWLPALASDPQAASASAWCTMGERVAWPRLGERNPPPLDVGRVAEAAAALAPIDPAPLPCASAHALLLRHRTWARCGGFGVQGFDSVCATVADLALRQRGLGWRHRLCAGAVVVRDARDAAGPGELERLAARWPQHAAQVAAFLLANPLRELRHALQAQLARVPQGSPQHELFAQ